MDTLTKTLKIAKANNSAPVPTVIKNHLNAGGLKFKDSCDERKTTVNVSFSRNYWWSYSEPTLLDYHPTYLGIQNVSVMYMPTTLLETKHGTAPLMFLLFYTDTRGERMFTPIYIYDTGEVITENRYHSLDEWDEWEPNVSEFNRILLNTLKIKRHRELKSLVSEKFKITDDSVVFNVTGNKVVTQLSHVKGRPCNKPEKLEASTPVAAVASEAVALDRVKDALSISESVNTTPQFKVLDVEKFVNNLTMLSKVTSNDPTTFEVAESNSQKELVDLVKKVEVLEKQVKEQDTVIRHLLRRISTYLDMV